MLFQCNGKPTLDFKRGQLLQQTTVKFTNCCKLNCVLLKCLMKHTKIKTEETGRGFASLTLKHRLRALLEILSSLKTTQQQLWLCISVHLWAPLRLFFITYLTYLFIFDTCSLSVFVCVCLVCVCLNLGDVIVQFVPHFGAIMDLHTSLFEWSGKKKIWGMRGWFLTYELAEKKYEVI